MYRRVAIVEEVDLIDEDTSPATLISPNTALALFLHSIRLAVWVEVDDWMIRPRVEEEAVRIWKEETGVDVLTEILLIVVVAYISVPEMIHLNGSVLSVVEVEYLFPFESRRLPETIM